MLPTSTLPRLTLDGALRNPAAGVTPVPANDALALTLVFRVPLVPETLRLPVTLPDCVGSNANDNFADPEGASVNGKPGPVKANPAPETDAFEIVILTVAVFVTLTDFVTLLPTSTLPNLIVEEESDNCPLATPASKENETRI